jgi:hypothetical protein
MLAGNTWCMEEGGTADRTEADIPKSHFRRMHLRGLTHFLSLVFALSVSLANPNPAVDSASTAARSLTARQPEMWIVQLIMPEGMNNFINFSCHPTDNFYVELFGVIKQSHTQSPAY